VPGLECTGISKHFGGVRALHDVSLAVRPGEVIGLVGPNGAGKTTLVDIMCGEQTADSGRVVVGDRRVEGAPARRARVFRMARTFQYPRVALDLTARENLSVAVDAHRLGTPLRVVRELLAGMVTGANGGRTAEIDDMSELLNLPDIDRQSRALGLGELRVLEVARALLLHPAVLLLDEPFAGTDALGAAGVAHAIREAAARGAAVVLVDHNVTLVSDVVDEMVLLVQGEVVFRGAAAECMASEEFRHAYFGERTHRR
jgi:branched-chain amino acid transport system ATP-binding protein